MTDEKRIAELIDLVYEYRTVVIDLLLCADCTWEERGEGNDWPEACQAARELLREPFATTDAPFQRALDRIDKAFLEVAEKEREERR